MTKKKGDKGGNPDPVQTSEFLAQRFKAAIDVPNDVELAKTALCVKLPADVDALVRPMTDRSVWLRRVIREAAEKELAGK